MRVFDEESLWYSVIVKWKTNIEEGRRMSDYGEWEQVTVVSE